MFLHVSVILCTGWGCGRQTPPGSQPPQQTDTPGQADNLPPTQADTPTPGQADTPRGLLQRTVRILLECILVVKLFTVDPFFPVSEVCKDILVVA